MNYCPLSLDCVWSVLVQWLTVSETQQIAFLFLPSLSNFMSSLYLWLLLLFRPFSFVIVFYLFPFLQFSFSCSVSCHLFISVFGSFPLFLFLSSFIHLSCCPSFVLPLLPSVVCSFLTTVQLYFLFLTLSVPHLLSWTSFPFTLITIFAFIYFLCFLKFSILRQNSSSCHPFTFCCVSFLSSLPSPLYFVSLFSFHLFLSSLLSLLTSFLTHVKCSAIWERSALSFLPPPSLSLLYLSPPLIHPPPPLSLSIHLLSTLSLCGDGFRQASSYQATGYMLIGSVSASRSLTSSCMGLTAVMYCWLLIAWSRGGSAHSHFLFSGWTFAWVPPGEVTSGIAILPCWVDAERLTAAA